MRRARLLLIPMALLAVAAPVVASALPAAASCAAAPDLAKSIGNGSTAFVGTVTSTTNAGRWATFSVEEVWSGSVSDTVVVKAGPPPPADPTQHSATSVDRTYEAGRRYLVVAMAGPGIAAASPGELTDTACSATTLWTEALASQRPAAARIVARDQGALSETTPTQGEAPDPPSTSSRSALAIGAGVAAVSLIAAACLFLFFRRGSIADRARSDLPEPADGPRNDPA